MPNLDLVSITLVVMGFGLIIFVHELGHFIMAKRAGIRVEIFSIGYGPKIWSITRGDTEYRLAVFPLGGYVKMAGENPSEQAQSAPSGPDPVRREPRGDEYNVQPIGRRARVIVAGSVMNFLFAFPLCVLFYIFYYVEMPPRIGGIWPGSPAYASSLRCGDKILEVNGKKVTSWQEINQKMIFNGDPGNTISFKVVHDGREQTVTVNTPAGFSNRVERMRLLGFAETDYVPGTKVGRVLEGAPAYGLLKKGDRILAINGEPVRQWNEVTQMINASTGREVALRIQRPKASTQGESEELDVKVVPKPFNELFKETPAFVPDIEAFQKTEIGYILLNSPADGKLNQGEVITSIKTDRHAAPVAVSRWGDIRDGIMSSDKTVSFTISGREGAPVTIEQGPGLRLTESIGIAPVEGLYVNRDYPAIDVRRGDQLVKIEDEVLGEWKPSSRLETGYSIFWPDDLHQNALCAKLNDKTIAMTFRRAGKEFTADVGYVPRREGSIGIMADPEEVPVSPGTLRAAWLGLKKPFDIVGLTLKSIPLLISGEISTRYLSGPVGIISMSYTSAKRGLGSLIWLMAVISVSLAVINMFPIPILDGGHVLFLAVEKIRGRPLSDKILIRAQYVGLAILLCIMLLATYNDVLDFRFVRNALG